MTKQETIKEAYGQYYDDCMPDENGWFNIHNAKIKFKNYYLLENFDEEGNYRRPKSLSGIENNNGWVKIESEDDFTKEDGLYYLPGYLDSENKFKVHKICRIRNLKTAYWAKCVTHYQPIIELPKPIY